MTELTVPITIPNQADPKLAQAARTGQGVTTIRGRVYEQIIAAASAETLRISPDDVQVQTHDDQGNLGITISTPLRQDDVLRCAVRSDQSVYELVKQARARVISLVTRIAGVKVGKVEVRLTGVKAISNERGLQ